MSGEANVSAIQSLIAGIKGASMSGPAPDAVAAAPADAVPTAVPEGQSAVPPVDPTGAAPPETSTPPTPDAGSPPVEGQLDDVEVPEEISNFIEGLSTDKVAAGKQLAKFLQTHSKSTVESLMGLLEPKLHAIVGDVAESRDAMHMFMAENSDLRPHRDLLLEAVDRVQTANPNMPYTQLWAKAGEEVRGRLSLKRESASLPEPDSAGGRPGNTPTASPEEYNKESMNSLVKSFTRR